MSVVVLLVVAVVVIVMCLHSFFIGLVGGSVGVLGRTVEGVQL